MSTTHNYLNCLSFNLLAFHMRNSNPEKLLDQGHLVILLLIHDSMSESCSNYPHSQKSALPTRSPMFIFNRSRYYHTHTHTFELKGFVVRKFIWTVIIVTLHHQEKSKCELMVQKSKDIWSGLWEHIGQSNYRKCLSVFSNRKQFWWLVLEQFLNSCLNYLLPDLASDV